MPGRSAGEGKAMELPGQRPLPERHEVPNLTTRLDGATRIRTEILVPLALSLVAVAAVFVLAGVVAIRNGEHAAGGIAVLGAAGAAGAMIWIGALLERTIRRPLAVVRNGLRQFARGNYEARLELQGAREVRELADAFNRMAACGGQELARLAELAATDALTGLASQSHFDDRVEAELRASRSGGLPLAVVAVELDGFGQLDKEHGPPAGDQALKKIARALRQVVHDAHLVARLEGDRFRLLLSPARPAYAREVAERARTAVARSLPPRSDVTVSAGIACFPADADDENDIAQLATLALEVAKRAGGDQTRSYDAEEVAAIPTIERQRREIDNLLRTPGAISTLLRPLVSLKSRRVLAHEAVPTIPCDERTWAAWLEQARRCDRSVMLEVATVRGALRARREVDTPFVTINLSPTTILSRRTLGLLPDRLDKLAIEISEQELAASESDLVEAFAQLRHRGARIVIDGVGGSGRALDQIVRLRPDAVKLDRTVIAQVGMDPDTATLIEVFTAVTKRVGATLWADGVNTAMQERALVDLGLVYAHTAAHVT